MTLTSRSCMTSQVLLAAHKAWFKLQQCSDCFAEILDIDKLRRASNHNQESQVATLPATSAGDVRKCIFCLEDSGCIL
jgi:hypothetical protein